MITFSFCRQSHYTSFQENLQAFFFGTKVLKNINLQVYNILGHIVETWFRSI